MPRIRHKLSNFFSEFIATLILVEGINIIYGSNQLEANIFFFGAILSGLLVLGISFSFGGIMSCVINPARDLGPRLAHAVLLKFNKEKSDWCFDWIPIFGPLCGGILRCTPKIGQIFKVEIKHQKY